jgi:hypothetical protein
MDPVNSSLQSRLANCLETILELERDLARLEMGHVLTSEFTQLRSFLARLDRVAVEEEDVARIEAATRSFLEELRTPLGGLPDEEARKRPVN